MRPPLYSLYVSLLVAACTTDDLDDLDTDEQASTNLDRPTGFSSVGDEAELTAGRLTKVPVSAVFHGQHTVSGAHTIRFRARCLDLLAPQDECDPTLLVVTQVAQTCGPRCSTFTTTDVALEDTDDVGTGNEFGAQASRRGLATQRYEVVAFSGDRGNALVAVEHSVGSGPWTSTWTDPVLGTSLSGGVRRVGGTLVRIGPMQPGEYAEVQTADDGVGPNSGTRAFFFNTARDRYAFSNPTTGDTDPRQTYDSSWTSAAGLGTVDQYAIIAKDATNLGSRAGIETRVDVITGPLGVGSVRALNGGFLCQGVTGANSTSRITCANGQETVLAPGRYYLWVEANTAGKGVGDTDAFPTATYSATTTGNDHCESIDRGRANDLAFAMAVRRDGNTVKTRYVPRGAVGNDDQWSRYYLEIEIPDDGVAHSYRVDVTRNAVNVRGQWGFIKNPDALDLKVATANIEYDKTWAQSQPRLENLADLLGTRGSIDAATGAIVETRSRGAWQWEADVVGTQEILGWPQATYVLDRLRAQTAYTWSYKYGQGKVRWWSGLAPAEYSPIFANQFAVSQFGMALSDSDAAAAGCADEHETSMENTGSCWLSTSYSDLGYKNYAVPARLEVRGAGAGIRGASQPVMVFSTYLNQGSLDLRDDGMSRLMDKIDILRTRTPGAFAAGGDLGNERFIIMGDLNMANHQCAEINHHLDELRERYGYAVDLASAQLDIYNRTFDMHYSGAPITDASQGIYGDCKVASWARLPSEHLVDPNVTCQGCTEGCPYRFKHRSVWQAENAAASASDPTIAAGPKFDFTPSQWFAWWAGSSAYGVGDGDYGSSRLDAIILVGRGWMKDDPLRKFMPLADVNFRSFSNNYEGGGVEIGECGSGTATAPGLVTTSDSYSPARSVAPECPSAPGSSTFYSDHKPIGARLRLMASP